jgi:flagellar protein FliL
MDETPAITPVTPVPKKSGGSKKVVVLLVVVLLLAGGTGGAWWWHTRTAAAAVPEPAETPLSERGLVTFEPFLVNLADAGGSRFLKINLQLVVGTAESAEHIQKTPVLLMPLRSAILEVLTQQSAPVLVTTEGKQALKTAIKAHVSPLLADQKVLDVLFSEFVVQF